MMDDLVDKRRENPSEPNDGSWLKKKWSSTPPPLSFFLTHTLTHTPSTFLVDFTDGLFESKKYENKILRT